MKIQIVSCHLYPIKSCAGIAVDALHFDALGHVLGDREWVVANAEGRMTWLGDLPGLARVRPVFVKGALHLNLGRHPSVGELLPLPSPQDCRPCTIEQWSPPDAGFVPLHGGDAGDEVAELASRVAGAPIRLVHVPGHAHRPHAIHIVSRASLQELHSEWLSGDGTVREMADPMMARFRPNLVIDTAPPEVFADGHENERRLQEAVPFIEDHAEALVFPSARGLLSLHVDEPCQRCIAIHVNPENGAVDTRLLDLVTRKTQERAPLGGSHFGVYAHARGEGLLRCGDQGQLVLNF